MSAPGGVVTRRALPRAIVLASRLDVRGRLARARHGARVELYFAFDDPCSAVALHDLSERLAPRRATLVLRPVVRRGIPGDPAVDDKRRYAIADARRLALRAGRALARTEPLPADATAPLAAWVANAPATAALEGFCAEAMRRLWFADDGPVPINDLVSAWSELGAGPPRGDEAAVRRNERRMRRRGPYDTPAAWVHGQWFFAHDRGPQIAARVDALGFGAGA